MITIDKVLDGHTDFSVEIATANRLAHQDRVAKLLAQTGGEVIHPDHYAFRMSFRDAILEAADEHCAANDIQKIKDKDLPEIFKVLDALAEKLWLRSVGLNA